VAVQAIMQFCPKPFKPVNWEGIALQLVGPMLTKTDKLAVAVGGAELVLDWPAISWRGQWS
jgi:hypothetical protein